MSPTTALTLRTARPALGLLLVAALASITAEPARAAAPFCKQTTSGPTYHWVGGTGSWNDAGNWRVGDNGALTSEAPGFTETDALVCIPSGGDVELVHNDGEARGEAIIRTLDLAPGATLTIGPNGRLYTSGTGEDRSIVRRSPGGSAGLLRLTGTYGGIGELLVDGRLGFTHRAGSGAPAMTTRHCITFPGLACHADAPPSTEPVTTPGRTVVGGRGVLIVSGQNGVNLDDKRVIDVRGRMEVVGPGYVAADDGTTIRIRPGGQLLLRGDASIYQGNFYFGQPRALVPLAGRVVRVGPVATSLVDARVEVAGTARVRVRSGFLSLGGDVAPTGRVRYGSSYGIGRCDGNDANCASPVASESDTQTVSVTLPGDRAGSVPVAVSERSGEQVSGDVAAPVRVHVEDPAVTARNPLRFRFRVDSSVLDSTPAASYEVRRRADGSAVYKVIPGCLGNGRPPAGRKACVASRSVAADGDLVVVVRTQVSSRWKIRKARHERG